MEKDGGVMRSVLVAVTIITLLPRFSTAQPQQPVTGRFIPVVVNLYPSSGTTELEAREAIASANGILRQADITLVPVIVNHIGQNNGGPGQFGGDNGSGGGRAGDGVFTDRGNEGGAIRTFGGKELRKLPNRRGIKIAFGMTPVAGLSTPGVSIHHDPTIIVKKAAKNAGPTGTGANIAHEVGHVLTLGVRHTIAGALKADAKTGHTPVGNGPTRDGNLMAGANRRNGTHLTPDQISELKSRAKSFGKCSTQFREEFPSVKCAIEFGATTDDRDDQRGNSTPPSYYDLHHVVLDSLDRTDRSGGDIRNLGAQIMVSGVLPVTGESDLMVALGFNSDGNGRTGVTYANVEGIDRIVYVVVGGERESGLRGFILNLTSKRTTELPTKPIAETEYLFIQDESADATPVATSFLFDIPKTSLPFSVTSVPVVAASGRIGSIADFADDRIFDFTEPFVYDRLRWRKDPTLTTFGDGVPIPGRPYRFRVSGLRPGDSMTLSLDGVAMFRGTLDRNGTRSGSFVFPSDLPTREFHFLTARDSTREFAYAITCPENERRDRD